MSSKCVFERKLCEDLTRSFVFDLVKKISVRLFQIEFISHLFKLQKADKHCIECTLIDNRTFDREHGV